LDLFSKFFCPLQSQSDFSSKHWYLDLGARVLQEKNNTTKFKVWAPNVSTVDLVLVSDNDRSEESLVRMERGSDDYFTQTLDVGEGTKYFYLLDGHKKRADPVSRFQPDGVHGPSQIVDDSSFKWNDSYWRGLSMEELIIYELHVGTYTEQGTFESLIPCVDYLVNQLGVTVIELMPVAQFPGSRNWGYDGVFMFAPQNSYGGPSSLKKLVNFCHNRGLGIILDVVYNHVGPEGNYLQDFGPYFSSKYHTPWGPSFNYDDRGCDNVRKYVISNALYWIKDYHFDGLRLDAIHGIFDFSPKHILEEIKDAVEVQSKELGRLVNIIAESDLNDTRIVRSKDKCGFDLDAQWLDDFHHSIHGYLTGEKFGYYQDFGSMEDIVKSLTDGFVYDGKYSLFRGRKHGESSKDIPRKKFVVFLQNHDQIGNRPDGSRLSSILKEKRLLKVAAGLLLLSPFVPLLFMGEEYGETAPFYYFVSHTDTELIRAVREGRKKEFENYKWGMEYIDPQDEQTFERSKINRDFTLLHHRSFNNNFNEELFRCYCELIKLRKSHRVLTRLDKQESKVSFNVRDKTLLIRRKRNGDELEEISLVCNFGSNEAKLDQIFLSSESESWRKLYDSNDPDSSSHSGDESYLAPGILDHNVVLFPPFTFAVYSRLQ
jgi:maltooligosyltrehalose trehalohydrolase